MREPVIVQTFNPVDFNVEEVESLVAALEDEGLEAWRYKVGADHLQKGQEGFGPPDMHEVVAIWMAATAGAAVINQVVGIVVEWLKEQFQREPKRTRITGEQVTVRPKRAFIFLYEGDEGQASEVVELESADAEPVRRLPEEVVYRLQGRAYILPVQGVTLEPQKKPRPEEFEKYTRKNPRAE
jgi:hypothetical protein